MTGEQPALKPPKNKPRSLGDLTPEQRKVHDRIKVERNITFKTVDLLIKNGYRLRVWDGEDWACIKTTDRKLVKNSLMSTEEDTLYVYDAQNNQVGWVAFVYGNDGGHGVIADYTCAMEDTLSEVEQYAKKLELGFLKP